MKNKIKLLFILGLTLFGFGMLFNEGPSIVEADAATSISEDVVNNVKATPMTREVESQSDPYEIDEIIELEPTKFPPPPEITEEPANEDIQNEEEPEQLTLFDGE